MGAYKQVFNPLTGQFDEVTTPGYIPEYDTDPATPVSQNAWVLRTHTPGTGGSPIGLLLPLTTPGAFTFQLSYRTVNNTTVRVALS